MTAMKSKFAFVFKKMTYKCNTRHNGPIKGKANLKRNLDYDNGLKQSFPTQETISSVQFSRSVMSNSLQSHETQHPRPPCPSSTPRVYPNSFPLSRWCHLTISSSDVPFSTCLQSFPTSGSFQMSQLFTSRGQNIGVSASTSVLPLNTQDWKRPWYLLIVPFQLHSESQTHNTLAAAKNEWNYEYISLYLFKQNLF